MQHETPVRFGALLSIAWLLVPIGGCDSGLRNADVRMGLDRARRENKLVLVEYVQLNCPHTARMDRDILLDRGVRERMKDFVRVRRNVRLNEEEARALNVAVTPTFLVYRADGTQVDRHDGAMSADDFRRFLIRACIKW